MFVRPIRAKRTTHTDPKELTQRHTQETETLKVNHERDENESRKGLGRCCKVIAKRQGRDEKEARRYCGRHPWVKPCHPEMGTKKNTRPVTLKTKQERGEKETTWGVIFACRWRSCRHQTGRPTSLWIEGRCSRCRSEPGLLLLVAKINQNHKGRVLLLLMILDRHSSAGSNY